VRQVCDNEHPKAPLVDRPRRVGDLADQARRVIAIDGKVLRGSRLPNGSQVHLLSAYDTP
jgi:hypothetical protein